MNCEEIEEKLSEYIEGRLDPSYAKDVQDHVFSCSRCQAEAQVLAHTRRTVSQLPSVEPPPGFSQRVMARIREEAGKPKLWQYLFLPLKIKIPIHTMAILLVGGLAIYLYQANKPASPPSPPADIELYSEPASPPPPASELRSRERDKISPASPGRRQDLKKEEKLPDQGVGILQAEKENQVEAPGKNPSKNIPVAKASPAPASPLIQTTDYELILIPKDPSKKGLTEKVEELIKKMGGQSVQTQEATTRSKQGLAIESQQDRLVKTQTLILIIPKDRYGPLKTELASLGKIEESSAAPKIPAGSMAAAKPSQEVSSSLRIKLILKLPE